MSNLFPRHSRLSARLLETIETAGGMYRGILCLARAIGEDPAHIRREVKLLSQAGQLEIIPGKPGRNTQPTIIKVIEYGSH